MDEELAWHHREPLDPIKKKLEHAFRCLPPGELAGKIVEFACTQCRKFGDCNTNSDAAVWRAW